MHDFYNQKVVISGNRIESFEYDYPIIRGFKRKTSVPRKRKDPNEIKTPRLDSLLRTRSKLKRLIYANEDLDKFVTLTFKENVTDITQANYIFHRFIDRLRHTKGHHTKYIAVIEFQQRGAIHYHCLMDLPYTDNQEIADIWKQGFIGINKIENGNMFGYLAKYIMKNQFDTRLAGKRKYLYSRNLNRPIVKTSKTHDEMKDFIAEKQGLDIDKTKPDRENTNIDPSGRTTTYKLYTGNGSM